MLHKLQFIFSNGSQNFLCKCLAQTPDELQGVILSFGTPVSTKVAQIYFSFLWGLHWKDISRKTFYVIPGRLLFVLFAWSSHSWRKCIGRLDSVLYKLILIITLNEISLILFFLCMRLRFQSEVVFDVFLNYESIFAYYCPNTLRNFHNKLDFADFAVGLLLVHYLINFKVNQVSLLLFQDVIQTCH